ncbi:hypothetical protein BY996DRAFT_6422688 [Phakopsora pachyrhizi]|nr:hypothetical protein BY996DRAFT_6422688 [Phakopsora pachyrhizi]
MTQGFPVTISNKEDQFFIQNQFGSYVRQKQIRNSLSFTRESRSHLSPKPIRTTVESRIKLTEQSPQHYARKCTLNVRNASGQINQAIRNKRVGKLEGEFENSELIRAEPQPAIISTISLPRAKVEISNLDNIGSYIQSEECKLSPMKQLVEGLQMTDELEINLPTKDLTPTREKSLACALNIFPKHQRCAIKLTIHLCARCIALAKLLKTIYVSQTKLEPCK